MSTDRNTVKPVAATAKPETAAAAAPRSFLAFAMEAQRSAATAPGGAFPSIPAPDAANFAAVVCAAYRTARAVVAERKGAPKDPAEIDSAAASYLAERMNTQGREPFAHYLTPGKLYPATSKRHGRPFWTGAAAARLVADCARFAE